MTFTDVLLSIQLETFFQAISENMFLGHGESSILRIGSEINAGNSVSVHHLYFETFELRENSL